MQTEYDCVMKWNDRLRAAYDDAKKARKGVSQTALAQACGVSSASVTDWLNGETKSIEARFLLPACKYLQVSPFWVMLGDDANYDFAQIPSDTQISALETVRLITGYAQSSDEGREKILMAVETTQKLFPRG